jgi:hypothetical protein
MLAIGIYGALCLLVALMAVDRKGGFILFLILSVALSPLIGMLILLIARTSVPSGADSKSALSEQAPQK